MSNTVLVNLFGGPGSGKSTLALGIAYELKTRGFEAHVTPEVAKPWALAGEPIDEAVQLQIVHEQFKLEQQYYGLVDFIISDSPLENNGFYGWVRNGAHDYTNIIERLRQEYYTRKQNFWIQRNKDYNPRGRYQTENEARKLDHQMIRYLTMHTSVVMQSIDLQSSKEFVEEYLCR